MQSGFVGSAQVIVTTCERIEGRKVVRYLGVVTGASVRGVVFYKDLVGKIKDVFGGRVGSYEKELKKAMEEAFADLVETAEKEGADAVIGLSCDMEAVGEHGTILAVVFTGTAVKLASEDDGEGRSG